MLKNTILHKPVPKNIQLSRSETAKLFGDLYSIPNSMTTAVTADRPKVICIGENPKTASCLENRPIIPQQIPAPITNNGAVLLLICGTRIPPFFTAAIAVIYCLAYRLQPLPYEAKNLFFYST